jgi:hypothetical protein
MCKPERCDDEIYPEETGISCFLFLPGGPELDFFWRLGTGSMLGPASEVGVFRTRGAGGSPTSAARGVTCSITRGFRTVETGVTKKKHEIRKADKIPEAQQDRRHRCQKRWPYEDHGCYRGVGSESGPSCERSQRRRDPDPHCPETGVWA